MDEQGQDPQDGKGGKAKKWAQPSHRAAFLATAASGLLQQSRPLDTRSKLAPRQRHLQMTASRRKGPWRAAAQGQGGEAPHASTPRTVLGIGSVSENNCSWGLETTSPCTRNAVVIFAAVGDVCGCLGVADEVNFKTTYKDWGGVHRESQG